MNIFINFEEEIETGTSSSDDRKPEIHNENLNRSVEELELSVPLVLREDAANSQQETGIGLFQFGAGLRHLVDLSQDFGFVGRVGGHYRLHGDFFLLQIGVEVDQAQAILLQDVIHLFLLVGVEVELLDHLRVVPPAALRLEALHRRTGAAGWLRCAVAAAGLTVAQLGRRRRVLVLATWGWSLRPGDGAGEEYG